MPIDSNIVVHVQDDGLGVDIATIVMTVEGAPVSPIIAGTPANYTLTYDPPMDFAYEQEVNVTIDASDLAGNGMPTDSYCFTTAVPPPSAVTLTANPVNITANGMSTSELTATVEDEYGNPVVDSTNVVFSTNHGSLGSSTVSKQTSGGVATATLTSESSTETIIATVTATADGVSDATAVFFIPEGGAGVVESQTETVTDSGTITDTPTGVGDVSIDATGDHNVTIAKYEDNPGGTPTFQATGDYYDVHLDNDTNVNSLTIEFCPATSETVIYYWDGIDWLPASNQDYDPIKECIVVTITASTFPSLSELTGLVFGSGFPVIYVEIDIKPGSDPNSLNLKSKGVVPVAVLTTDDFDAGTVDPGTVLFADAQPVRCTLEDVDSDGDLDMLFHFKMQDLNLTQESTEATLIGETNIGQSVEGTDTVKIVPRSK